MNEQHLDALPPVNVGPASEKGAEPQSGEAPKESLTGVGGPAAGSLMQSPAVAGVPATPTPGAATTASQDEDVVGQQLQGASPVIADDIDLIEKEWVMKAKQIVEQTKHDPHQQNEQMTKIKADYLKKRYNRDIKLSESSS